MSQGQCFYETYRDVHPLPACWVSQNNYCYPHYHSTIELVFCFEGEMEATLNGKNYSLQQNQILIVPSYTVHRFHTPDYSKVIILTIPLDYITSFRNLMGKQTFPLFILEDCDMIEELSYFFTELVKMNQQEPHPYRLRGYVYTILGILLEHVSLEKRTEVTEPHQLQNILSYLDDNFLSPLTLEDIATNFGYSKSRFSHIFNENVGCSITDYLGFLRSRRAASLLTSDSSNITDIALDSGFGSTRSFYRTFQKCFGLTPNEFRKLDKGEQAKLTSRHPVVPVA